MYFITYTLLQVTNYFELQLKSMKLCSRVSERGIFSNICPKTVSESLIFKQHYLSDMFFLELISIPDYLNYFLKIHLGL